MGQASTKASHVAEVREHNGAPTVFVDERPVSGFGYVGDVPEHCRQIGEAGLRFNSIVTRAQYAFYPDPPDAAAAARQIADHDALIRRIVAVWPDVLFFPRLQLETPVWWAERYPKHVTKYDEGGGLIKPITSPKHGIPSWASPLWREQTLAALKGYIEHVRGTDFGGRFVGYHLAAGTSAEWMAHGSNSGLFVDYSEPAVAAFRDWLWRRYRDDVERLRRAWNDPSASFETAAIPPRERRAAFDGQSLLDPAADMPVIDHARFFSDLTAEMIAALARGVKEFTQRRAFVGAFYGYVLQLCNEQRQQNAGHMAIRKVLNCPDLDFIAGPAHYGNRRLGEGYASFMTVTESVRLHGKLFYSENDFLSPLGSRGAQDSGAKTVEEFAEVLKCAHASVVTNAVQQWLLAFNEPWYSDPKLLALLKRQQAIDTEALDWDRASVNQIAVIVDDRSQLYQPAANVLPEFKHESLSEMLIYDLPRRLGRCGAGFDWLLLDDLDRCRPYRLYIVLNAFAISDRKRSLLKWRVRRDGATVLWMYAPGAIQERIDPAGITDLVGMQVLMSREAVPVSIALETADHPLLGRTMTGVRTMGNEHRIAPRFWIDEPSATVLARSTHDGKPALAVRRFDDWTSVYLASPLTLDDRFIREAARLAGAHIYFEGRDALYVGPGLVGIHASTSGGKRIKLPYRCSIVRELYDDTIAARDTDSIECELGQYETRLFRFTQ